MRGWGGVAGDAGAAGGLISRLTGVAGHRPAWRGAGATGMRAGADADEEGFG